MRTEIQTPETHIATSRPRRRSWLLLIPALAVLGIAGGAYTSAQAQTAEATDAGPGGFGARRLERLLDKVNATASQRSQIEAIWNGLRPQLKSFHQQQRGGAPADRCRALRVDDQPGDGRAAPQAGDGHRRPDVVDVHAGAGADGAGPDARSAQNGGCRDRRRHADASSTATA